MDMKRFFLYFIVIAALALAGCGGGGNGPAAPPPPPPPPPPGPSAIDLSGLLMGFGLTADDVGDHEIAAGQSMDVGNATFTCPAGAGCTVTVAMADDGTITATSTGGQVTASPSPAAQMAYEAKQEEDKKAALAKGMGIAMALQTPNGPVPGRGTGDSTTMPVAVTRATTGDAKIKLSVVDPTDAAATVDFADADDITRSTPPAITGWMGETQSRTAAGTTDMVTVYTDIKNATPQKLEYAAGAIPDPGTAGNLIILEDQEGAYSNADDTEIKGTVNGIAGTFTCDTGCTAITTLGDSATAEQDKNTVTVNLGAGWSFESDENVERVATQDPDYLYFGYWLQDEGDNDFAFNTFFGGNAGFTLADALVTETTADTGSTAFTAVESKAVYTGSAAGKYVEKTLAVQGGEAVPVAIAGDYFTADASLTAYFGQTPNVAENMQNTIRGTISNFKNSNGDDVNFRITLEAIDFGDTTNQGDQSTSPGSFMNGTVAGIHGSGSDITQTLEGAAGGGWKGQFFGAVGTGDNAGLTKPTGVAGDFQAHFNDAHVVGAFGATR